MTKTIQLNWNCCLVCGSLSLSHSLVMCVCGGIPVYYMGESMNANTNAKKNCDFPAQFLIYYLD